MKSQKLIVIAAIVCLLVGASGAAMALDCADGVIQGEEGEPLVVEEDIIIEGQSCSIKDVEVAGNIEVINSEHITIEFV
jgi:hypothetical protein